MTKSTGQRIRRGTRTLWVNEHLGRHMCDCGCGEFVPVKPEHYPTPPRFVHGHNGRLIERKPPKVQTPCECKCGELARPGRRYLPYHARKPKTSPRHLVQKCGCGCGEMTGPGARYVYGHHQRRPLLDRVLEKIERTEGCWLWTGHRNHKGYGYTSVEGRHVGAHRVMYELHVGPIPDGLEIDHLCNTRHCVRPDHLEPVTHAENLRRARTRRRVA